MKEYQDDLDLIKTYFDGCATEEVIRALDNLQNLLYQYKMRLADAELLNKLRKITNTQGDLDLLNKVKERFENDNK